MKIIHFDSLNSTQEYLIDNITHLYPEGHKQILVSTSWQTKGRGRQSHTWDFYKNSIALSCTVNANDNLALTTLEVGVIVLLFFKEKFNIELNLKWPNDLLNTQGKKCGGILTNFHANDCLIVGIGLNLSFQDGDNDSFGYIFDNHSHNIDKASVSQEIYQYILNNRKNPTDTIDLWNRYCLHINREIYIVDNNHKIKGNFLGLGKNGGAMIQDRQNGNIKEFMAGSLYLE